MRKYLVIGLLLVAGLVTSWYIIPARDEIALMQFKDKQFEQARKAYEEQLSSGDGNVNVVSSLTDLYLQYGDIDSAIATVERYLEQKPGDLEARKYLGTLYQFAQRPDDYLRNLEKLQELRPSEDKLSELTDIYDFTGEYEKKIPAIEDLILVQETKDPQYYVSLAHLQASKKQYADAIETLITLKNDYPDSMSFGEAELLVSLLMDTKRYDEAYGEAKAWLDRTDKEQEIARLINIVNFKGSPRFAWKLLQPYDAGGLEDYPLLLTEKVYLLLSQGRREDAYSVMQDMYAADKLPQSLYKEYLLVALERDEPELVAELSELIDPDLFSEDELIRMIELAYMHRAQGLLGMVRERFGTVEMQAKYPLMAAVLALTTDDPSTDSKLAALDGYEMNNRQLIQLAGICARTGRKSHTHKYLSRLDSVDSLSEAELLALGEVYLLTGNYRKGYDALTAAAADRNSESLDRLAIKFATALGYDDDVVRWVDASALISDRQLSDMFFLAHENRHRNLAIFLAEKYYAKSENETTRDYLVNAYMSAGRYADALPFLREKHDASDTDADNYLAVLTKLAAQDPSYRQELARFAAARLNSDLSHKRKLALIYALIDAGRSDIAMPYIRDLALSEGGDWVTIYAENLEKQGNYAAARDFWLQLANDSSTTTGEKRQIAYGLLNRGYKDDAVAIFGKLAQNAPADSSDVKQLLYLWGPRIEQAQADWLATRAEFSEGAQRDLWLEYLVSYTTADTLVSYIDKTPALLNNPKIVSAYMEALQQSGRLESEHERVFSMASDSNNPDMLRAYARVARAHGMNRAARKGYEALLQMVGDKGDREAQRNIGLIAFSQADYTTARKHLGTYITERESRLDYSDDDYLPYFYFAEILRQEHRTEDAQDFYQRTLDLIIPISTRTPDMESKAAQSMAQLGDIASSNRVFKRLLEKYPDNEELRADYISTLIEARHYEAAQHILNVPQKTIRTGISANALPLNGIGDIEGYRTLNNGREILLQFKRRKGGKGSAVNVIDPQNLEQYEWVGYGSEGFDRLLIVAKHGYTLDLVPTGNGYVISPATAPDIAGNDFARQIRLRHSLLQARLNLETGKHYKAAEDLKTLGAEYADDSQYLGYTANAENYIGRWKQALALLEKAHALAPENQDITGLIRDIKRAHSPNVKVSYDWIKIGDSTSQIHTVSGYADITDRIEVGGNLQVNNMDAENVRRASGIVGDFDKTRQRGEVYVAYHYNDGARAQASLFANNDDIGTGLYYRFIHPYGESEIYGEYRRPNWEFVEGVLDDLTRDRIGLRHLAKINPRILLSGGIAYNRYNVRDNTDVIQSVSLAGSATYQLQERGPYLAANYSLDAEYRTDEEILIDSVGTRFTPLPMDSREVHTLSILANHDFTKNLIAELQAGYSFDRLGGSGPLIEGRLTQHLDDDNFEAQLRGGFGKRDGNREGETSHVGGHLMWKF